MSIFRQPPPHIMLYNSTDPPQKLYNTRLDPAPLNQRAVKTRSMDTYYISCPKNVTCYLHHKPILNFDTIWLNCTEELYTL